jgi:hypothetical protein
LTFLRRAYRNQEHESDKKMRRDRRIKRLIPAGYKFLDGLLRNGLARHEWLTPIILATWKAEMEVRGQPGQKFQETPFPK